MELRGSSVLLICGLVAHGQRRTVEGPFVRITHLRVSLDANPKLHAYEEGSAGRDVKNGKVAGKQKC